MEKHDVLIAKFMGYEVKEHHKTPGFWLYLKEKGVENGKEYTNWAAIDFDLDYGSSWDKLMPVVERIERIGGQIDITFSIDTHETWIIQNTQFNTHQYDGTKIERTYRAVVEYINWHNA